MKSPFEEFLTEALQKFEAHLKNGTLPVSMFDFCLTSFGLFGGGEKLAGDGAIAGLHGPR